jgi:hypothetical protein
MDGLRLESVGSDVPVTDMMSALPKPLPKQPNLRFED